MVKGSKEYWWTKEKFICYDSAEVVFGYKNYLNTKHWLKLRDHIYIRDEGKCQHCGKAVTKKDSNVHHIRYDNVGKENEDDLVLLCRECHEKVHNVSKDQVHAPIKTKTKKKKKNKNKHLSYQSVLQKTINMLRELKAEDQQKVIETLQKKFTEGRINKWQINECLQRK